MVIAIIGVLASLIFAAVGGVRGRSEAVRSSNNLRQIGMAFRLYIGEHDGRLPNRARPEDVDPNATEAAITKWPALIARYLSDPRPFADPSDTENYLVAKNPLERDPLAQSLNNTSYIYNGFNDLGIYNEPTMEIFVTRFERPASTILLGIPQSGDTNFFMDFEESNQKSILSLNAFGNGSNYLFLDGSVRFIAAEDYVRVVEGKRNGDLMWLADKSRTDVIK